MTSAFRVALLGVVGSVAAALITTTGVIWGNKSNLSEARVQVKALQDEAARIRLAVPVGTVVASMLDHVQFASAAGDPENFDIATSKWTLADGKTVHGTAWAALKADRPVPDLRGLFLRGRNYDRGSDKGNPEGDLAVGQFQADQFQEHIHEFNRGGNPGTETGYAFSGTRNDGVPRGSTNSITSGNHGAETRPRNVTVNFYIRINN